MRSFEERKAEVLSRSEAAIVKRKANVKRIMAVVAILSVCVCVFVGYKVMNVPKDPPRLQQPTHSPDLSPNSNKGNGNNNENEPKISPTLAAMIKEQYAAKHAELSNHANATADDILINNYKGFFNGTIVLMVNCDCTSYSKEAHSETVGGVKIEYPDGRSYTVWDGEYFYSLTEAYEKSVLRLKDIEKLAGKNIT